MSIKSKDFLKFEGVDVYFLLEASTWWIALKPICEALNVPWNHQHQKLQSDIILSKIYTTKKIYIPGDQYRPMVCLPEQFIYGWLFQIQSDSDELIQYKWKCYNLLYEHFHGTLVKRHQALMDKSTLQDRIDTLEKELSSTKEYNELQELKAQQRKMNSFLKELDKEIIDSQMTLADW